MEKKLKITALCLFLVLLAVFSATILADTFSSPDKYSHFIEQIDGEISTVQKLTAASALSSAVVSSLPGDAATPIAEKLADCSEYLLLVMCVLYAEKYLLTILGTAVFRIVIPIVVIIIIIGIIAKSRILHYTAFKILVLGVALMCVIPISVTLSDRICTAYQTSIDDTVSSAEAFTGEASGIDENSSIWDRITGTATSLLDRASQILSAMMQTLAVMIVTSCVIPLLVLVFFLWLVKIITGTELHIPRPHHGHGKKTESAEETE